ncbi:proline racemase family protein [Aureibacillus halotolerans]|uniref:Proline racemase n=1 Tax=Aureibacillus halotolerans TaxID=1508390 RepID=A0A4R6TUU6_9BACI|nr:proline racemase family protein [Aureibacillus halotolerans]TDQ35444.1 proline racemase [Aureibacillus halotolerans]
MKYTTLVTTIDTHTGGNPTRTVISGAPKLNGSTMSERMLDMKMHHDWFRRALMNEPRGHSVMSGAILQEPTHPEADIGVIFIETGGYLPMCGHDTVGFCTALVEAGLITTSEPVTSIVLDTPAGLVSTEILVKDGEALEVSFNNVASFHYKQFALDVENTEAMTVDVAYGGNFYGIVSAREAGVVIDPKRTEPIIEKAMTIRKAVNALQSFVHPNNTFISGVTHIEFYDDPVNPEADVRNTVVVPPGGIDRSPCGTGTSAKMASLYSHGKLQVGSSFIHESIVGSLFKGTIVREEMVGQFKGIVPRITGEAWVTGHHQYMLRRDEEETGFLLIPQLEIH